MKALLLKDLYYIKNNIFLFLAFFAYCALATASSVALSEASTNFYIYLIMFFLMVLSSLLISEKKEKWRSFSITMPYTREQIVNEKYLLNLILQAITIVIVLILLYVQTEYKISFTYEVFISTLKRMPFICFMPSASFLAYHFGNKKTKVISLLLLFAASFCILKYGTKMGTAPLTPETGEVIPIPSGSVDTAIPLIISIISIIYYPISWRVTLRAFKNKDA